MLYVCTGSVCHELVIVGILLQGKSTLIVALLITYYWGTLAESCCRGQNQSTACFDCWPKCAHLGAFFTGFYCHFDHPEQYQTILLPVKNSQALLKLKIKTGIRVSKVSSFRISDSKNIRKYTALKWSEVIGVHTVLCTFKCWKC